MTTCEVCNADIDTEDDDVTYRHEVVRLGDGTIDDEFYVCQACVDAAREYDRTPVTSNFLETARSLKIQAQAQARRQCRTCEEIGGGFGPSHKGSAACESGSIASGGARAHCACDACF